MCVICAHDNTKFSPLYTQTENQTRTKTHLFDFSLSEGGNTARYSQTRAHTHTQIHSGKIAKTNKFRKSKPNEQKMK